MSDHVYTAHIELRGHIIDSLTLPRVFGAIMADGESDFEVEEFTIGRHNPAIKNSKPRPDLLSVCFSSRSAIALPLASVE